MIQDIHVGVKIKTENGYVQVDADYFNEIEKEIQLLGSIFQESLNKKYSNDVVVEIYLSAVYIREGDR